MQERSIEFRERHAVASIPNDTVTDRGEVYPNLVGAPGLKRELNQRGVGSRPAALKECHGRLTRENHAHARRVAQIAAERCVDACSRWSGAAHEREVAPLHLVMSDHCLEALSGHGATSQHDESARAEVEPVHDAATQLVASELLELGEPGAGPVCDARALVPGMSTVRE